MRLAFDTAGPATGLPIVLLHGLTDSRERNSHLVDWLSSRGYPDTEMPSGLNREHLNVASFSSVVS